MKQHSGQLNLSLGNRNETLFLEGRAYSFVTAATTKHHKLSDKQKFIFSQFWRLEVQDQGVFMLFWGLFLVPRPHMIMLLSVLSVSLSPLLIRTLVPVDESSFSCPHFTAISPFKAPLPNTATIWVWLRLLKRNLGGGRWQGTAQFSSEYWLEVLL